MNFYFGIDIGGTFIKGGIVNEDNSIVCKSSVSTSPIENSDYLVDSIFELIEKLEAESGLSLEKSSGIGIGAPGLIDCSNGVVGFSGNLKLKNYPLVERMKKRTSVPVVLANDADVATLAEAVIGAGKKYKTFIMLTLGTGIGSGIYINGNLYANSSPYGGEIGHMKISESGVKCSCGDKNCFEALASTKALVSQTREAMKLHPESKMWSKYNLQTANGKTVFEFMKTDRVAKDVFKQYITHLGNGIVSLYNIFCPEAIIVGGAICNQGDNLLVPLTEYVNNHIYVKNINYTANIVVADQKDDAGIVGSKCLLSKGI